MYLLGLLNDICRVGVAMLERTNAFTSIYESTRDYRCKPHYARSRGTDLWIGDKFATGKVRPARPNFLFLNVSPIAGTCEAKLFIYLPPGAWKIKLVTTFFIHYAKRCASFVYSIYNSRVRACSERVRFRFFLKLHNIIAQSSRHDYVYVCLARHHINYVVPNLTKS